MMTKIPPSQVKRRVYYQFFEELLNAIEESGTKAEILYAVWKLMDGHSLFKYAHISESAHDSINRLVAERLPKEKFLIDV